MSAYQGAVLILSVLVWAYAPVLLWQAARHKDFPRVYDVVLVVIILGMICWESFHPQPFRQMMPMQRWLEASVMLIAIYRFHVHSHRRSNKHKMNSPPNDTRRHI